MPAALRHAVLVLAALYAVVALSPCPGVVLPGRVSESSQAAHPGSSAHEAPAEAPPVLRSACFCGCKGITAASTIGGVHQIGPSRAPGHDLPKATPAAGLLVVRAPDAPEPGRDPVPI